MEDQKQTKVSKFLSSLLPKVDIQTQVGINQSQVMETAAMLFIVSVLIILAYFSLQKVFK